MSPDRNTEFGSRLRALFVRTPFLLLTLPGCTQQPQPQVQERPTPVVIVVTATPTETPPTVVPTLEPTVSPTQEPPPTATSSPVRREPTPAPVQESLFQTWGVYRGALGGRSLQPEGQIVITPLPSGDIFIFSHRENKDCPDKSTQFSYGGFLVRRSSRAERGFSQTDEISNVYTAGVIKPGLLGGNVIFRDDVPVAGLPTCKGATLSFQAELKGNGRQTLGIELAAAKKAVSGGDNAPEDMLKLVENLCKCTLPEPK